jgi:glycosyltransferase involved in cell wall biosynthesis
MSNLPQELDLTRALLGQARVDRDSCELHNRELEDVVRQLQADLRFMHARLFAEQKAHLVTSNQLARITNSRAHRLTSKLIRELPPVDSKVSSNAAPAPVQTPQSEEELPDQEERGAPGYLTSNRITPGHPTDGLRRAESLPENLIALDVSALNDPARTGISRVIIRLAQELDRLHPTRLRLVAETESVIRFSADHASEIFGRPAPERHLQLTGQMVRGPGALLISASIQEPNKVTTWGEAIKAFTDSGGHYVQVVHDLLPVTMPDFFDYSMREHFPRWLRLISQQAELILTISDATQDELRDWLTHQELQVGTPIIATLVLGSDVTAFSPIPAEPTTGNQDEHPRVLIVGTIEPRKAYDAILDAASSVWDVAPDIEFLVVGSKGWASPELLDRFESLSASELPLRWLTNVSDEELSWLYRSCDLLVAPSRGEGFGLPISEALGAGLPVLARDVPAFRELLGSTGNYFNTDAELAGAIVTTMGANESAQGMIQKPKSWADSASMLLALTDQLVP